MKSPTKSKRHRFYSLFRRDSEVGQLLVRNPLTRRLRIEQLEDRRMLAPLYGIDFDTPGNNSPLNFKRLDESAIGNQYFGIGGSVYNIALFDTELNESKANHMIPPAVPFVFPPIDSINGSLEINFGIEAIWSGLDSSKTYEIFVFDSVNLREEAESRDVTVTFGNSISHFFTPFSNELPPTNTMWVNGMPVVDGTNSQRTVSGGCKPMA